MYYYHMYLENFVHCYEDKQHQYSNHAWLST